MAFTKGTIKLIYGETFKNIEIHFIENCKISEGSEKLKLVISDEQLIYFWYRFLDIILNETKFNAKLIPDLHTALARSIASVIDLILNICNHRVQAKSIELQVLVKNSSDSRLSEYLQCFYNVHFNYTLGLYRIPIPSIDSILDLFGE